MLQRWKRPEFCKKKERTAHRKTDYNTYSFSAREWMLYLAQAVGITGMLGYFFYRSGEMTLLLMPLVPILIKQKKQERCIKRKQELTRQFKETMIAVDNSLQAGYSLENAFVEAYKEMSAFYKESSVIVVELDSIRTGMQNGWQLEELLQDLGERSGIEDILDFVNVLVIGKKSGGNINRIIKSAVSVIEEKMETKQEIEVLLSSKKLEAKIMSGIPFFIILYIGMTSKGYFDTLYQTIGGNLFMTVCLAVYLAAVKLARKMTEIEV